MKSLNGQPLHPIDKIDMCAQEVRVSVEGLKELAQIAVFHARCDCERNLNQIQTNSNANPFTAISCAKSLSISANQLAVALKFLYAFESLVEGERTELNIYPQRKI